MYMAIFSAILSVTAFFGEPDDPIRKDGTPLLSLATLAGEYSYSDGFSGERLKIDSDGRFKLTYHMCTGESHAYGRAKLVGGHVILRTSLVSRAFFPDAPGELIPIHWGERLYLVPKERGRNFCDYVNIEGPEPGWPSNTFFARSGDGKRPAAGIPRVPKEWESMLLPAPINGKVVEVIGRGRAG